MSDVTPEIWINSQWFECCTAAQSLNCEDVGQYKVEEIQTAIIDRIN